MSAASERLELYGHRARQRIHADARAPEAAMRIQGYGRYWAVYDRDGKLVCVCVYKKGAEEVRRRLGG